MIKVHCDIAGCKIVDNLSAAELALLLKDNLAGWSCSGVDTLCGECFSEFLKKSSKAERQGARQ